MKSVNVAKETILDTLKANRETHVLNYEKAMEGYKAEVHDAIQAATHDFNEGNLDIAHHFTALDKPVTYQKQYDDVIGMLEMATDTEIELSTEEYRQFVLDEWQWKHHFLSNTQKYLG